MRPPSGGIQAAGFNAPGSRAGPGTQYGQPMVGMGNALNTQLEVTLRPVTKEGLGGIAPGSLGPGRQVADRSYYLGILRAKNVELQAEIQRLNQEQETIIKNNAAQVSMDSKAKGLEKEIHDLKNLLSDYNFAVSKATSGADLNTLKSDTEQLKAYNAQQSERVDQVFIESKQRDSKARDLESQINQQLEEMDAKLNAEPEKKARYLDLREESTKLMEEILPKQRDLEFLQRKHKTLQTELKGDQVKQAALKLQDRKLKLEQKKADTLEEIKTHGGTLPDEKTRLMNQVKSETNEIEALQAEAEEVKAETQKVKESLAALENDLLEYKGDRAEKYKELEAKDREMQDFIDKFDDSKKETVDAMSKTESNIVHLLETIGKNLAATNNLPSQQQVQEMSADLEFKKKQMDFSVSTHERLKNELELRKKELEKVDNLDAKITSELEAITEKIRQNEEAIKTYSNLDALRQDADERKRDLIKKKTESSNLRDALKTAVHLLTVSKYEPLKQSLAENEVYMKLQQQEQKIRAVWQNVFQLSDFVAQKGSEADYLPLKATCLSMCEEINDLIKEHNAPK
jgi:intraflagellar transport protein 74